MPDIVADSNNPLDADAGSLFEDDESSYTPPDDTGFYTPDRTNDLNGTRKGEKHDPWDVIYEHDDTRPQPATGPPRTVRSLITVR